MTTNRKETYLGLGLVLVLLVGILARTLAGMMPGSMASLIAGQLLVALAMLCHAMRMLGRKRALTFFALTVGISFVMEALSIATALATPYHYTAILGPRMLGVPVVVPLGWFGMMYPSYVVVNLMLRGKPTSTRGRGVFIIFLSLLTALTMTSWDLTMDPYMVYKVKAWVWEQPSGFLGIPFANYVSWFELSFIINLTYRVVERDMTPLPEPEVGPWMAAIPVLVFALTGLSDVVLGVPEGTRILSPFTMGIPVLFALARLLQMQPQARTEGDR